MASGAEWSYALRPMDPGDRGPALDMFWRAFGWGVRTEDADAVFADRAIELKRTVVALDTGTGTGSDEIVGTTSAYSLTMTMPGGAFVPVAGVFLVAVEPTHRRRGVMSFMMCHQLEGLVNGGEAVAARWTTDPAIYQRFGYGLATWRSRIGLDLARARFSQRAESLASSSPARLRRMSVGDALPHLAVVHEKIVGSRATNWSSRQNYPSSSATSGMRTTTTNLISATMDGPRLGLVATPRYELTARNYRRALTHSGGL